MARCSGRGRQLVALHVMEQENLSLPSYPVAGNNVVEKIEYRVPPDHGRAYLNGTQYFEGMPPDVWEFHVGGDQVCYTWLKDRKGHCPMRISPITAHHCSAGRDDCADGAYRRDD